MTFMLKETGTRRDPPALTEQVPTYGEQFRAQFGASQIEQDAWSKSNRVRREVRDELSAALESFQIPEDPNRRQNARTGKSREFRERALLEQVEFRAAEDPERFKDLPKTPEEFRAEVNRRLLQEYEGLIGTAEAGPADRIGARTLGTLASGAADEATILTLPLGAGAGSMARVIAVEALAGAGGEVFMLPRQFRMAERLGIDDPNVPLQLGIAAATGGILGGGLIGAGRYLTYRQGKAAAVAEGRPEGQDPIEYERAVEEAEDQLRRGDPPAPEKPAPTGRPPAMSDFDFSARGNASPNGNRVGYVFGRLLELGYEPHIAAGLTGNLMQESGAGLHTAAVGDNGNAFGMGQWNGPRRRAYLAFARKSGKPPEDLDTQIAFLDLELRTTESAAMEQIRQAPDAQTAARIASEKFWRPGVPHLTNRMQFARSLADQFEAGQIPRYNGKAPLPASDVPQITGPTSRGYTGEGSVTAGDDLTIDVSYQVVDASILRQASGDLQPRDRSRAASDEQIAELAARLDPIRLMPSPEADRGAPIVAPDDIIESGNGRVRAIQRAAERYPDRFQAYVDQIKAAGFEVPEGVTTPVLIARRTTDLDLPGRQRFVRQANSSAVARMSATERAAADARAIDEDTVRLFEPGQSMNAAANRAFVTRALKSLPQAERNALFDSTGALNREGTQRLSQALFARAYDAPDILARFTETDAGEFRSLLDALSMAAPEWAALRADVAAGLVKPEMDITPFVLDAMRTIAAARDIAAREGGSAAAVLDELLDQVDLLEGALAPLTVALVRKFAPGGRAVAAERTAAFLTRYAAEARKVGTTEAGLLGDGPDVADVLRAIDRETFADLEDIGRPMARETPDPGRAGISAAELERFDDGAQGPDLQDANAQSIRELTEQAERGAPALTDVSDPVAFDRDLRMSQPFDDLDGLYRLAGETQTELEAIGRAISDELGVEFKSSGLKKRATAEEKMQRKRYSSPRQITDIARGGFVARSADEADRIVARLAEVADVVDEGWTVKPSGYFDRKVILRGSNGVLAEVQIWADKLLEAKNSSGHKLYQQSRSLTDDVAIAELDAQQAALYSAAIEASDPSFAALAGSSNSPKVVANFDLSAAKSGTTDPELNTSRASTGSQSAPGSSNANASEGETRTAGRPSQSANTNDVMGNTSSANISADGADGNTLPDLGAVREEFDLAGVDLREISFEDDNGVMVSMADYLDDLEQDATLKAAVDACTLGRAS
ncbi:hypothetical protein KX928_23360 [Roseobacter sp. YSTF-M11]|uniref:Phage tail lysozyme domain-containing protein n=1 Tax=Roseobacter insulae TaxID=2859783 RepID=A0A9X1FZT9_9RHOB|nr:phage tail tip lysozyme [Roseobacter insulae]MBW4710739.1 hypothetical protein [Roseobacter insulae]